MDRNSNQTSSSSRTRAAGAKCHNDYETCKDDLVDHQRLIPSEKSNRQSVPRKPPRKVPPAYRPADAAATEESKALGVQEPRLPQQTTIRSTVSIHPNLSSPPPPSTNRLSISKLSLAPPSPVPPSARSSTKNFPPPPVVPAVSPQIPPLAHHRAAPLVPRTVSSQAHPPVPTTISIRAAPHVPRMVSSLAPLPNPSRASLRVHLQNHPTAISRPSIPPPPPPLAPTSSLPPVPSPPPPSLLSSPPPLLHTRPLPSIRSTAPHPTQSSTLSASSSIDSNIIPSLSVSTKPSGRTMSTTCSLSNSQTSPSTHSLSSVQLSPLTASRSAPDTGNQVISDPFFPVQESQQLRTSGSAQRQQPTETPPTATDMKGVLLKLVDRKWKSRYFVLRSKFWALEYYQTMSDAQSNSAVVRGVYPLLGAQTSGLVEVDEGFLFILTLRTSQMIQLKLPEKTEMERWRQSIQATSQHPLPNFIGDVKNGTTELVQSRHSSTRNIRLNFLAGYLYFYKKNSQDALTGLHLMGAHITMEKGSKKGFDITIKTPLEIQTVLRFPTLEEWVSWGTALESCAISN